MDELSPHPHVVTALSIAWAVYLVGLAVWIILQKRPPASTLFWLLLLALLPYAGYAIYYFFGPQRLKRGRHRRLRSRVLVAGEAERARIRENARDYDAIGPRQMVALGQATADVPLSSATDIQLLVDGADTYEAFLRAIDGARQHIHVEFYIYEPDRIGTLIRDRLIARAQAGVTVRFLVDALGSARLGRRFFAPMRAAGIQIGLFHHVRIGRRVRPVTNFRNHRKILIVDGTLGFMGGLNVTDEQDERIHPRAYHDVHLRLEGGVVRWLQMVFLEDWAYATSHRAGADELDSLLPPTPPGPHALQILASGPDDPRESIHRMQIAAINAATSRAWLTTAYFVPSEAALMSLQLAALRGVDVRILVPQRSDSRFVSAAARSYYRELLEAGVKIWEYEDRMLHSKTLVVDDAYAFVGTANFDNRSFQLNFEVCALIYGEEMARTLRRQFEHDLRQALRVPYPRPQRPLMTRLFEGTARLFSPVL